MRNKALGYVFLIPFLCLPTIMVAQTTNPRSSIFGNMRARHIGSATMSGRVSDIDAVNKNPKIIYVGAAGGGVWKSVNGGTVFKPIFDDYCQSIGKITIDQNSPDTVYVGTGEPWTRNSVSIGKGLYRTTNGGSSWEKLGFENSERIADIVVDSKNSNIIYVAVLGHLWDSNPERGVYKSEDFGKTWTQILYIDENTGATDLSMDSQNPNIVYASMWEHRRYPDYFDSGMSGQSSGLYKSTDSGKTWTCLTKAGDNGLPLTKYGRIAVEIAPSNPNTIYLTAELEGKEQRGLYKSIDGGQSWKLINKDFGITVRPFYFSRLNVHPKNDSIIYKAGLNALISSDGGQKFRQLGSNVHSDMHCFWINPQYTNEIYVGTDGGVYRSVDGGYNFEALRNLPISQFYHVSLDNAEPYNVYGGLQDNGSWTAPSRKNTPITNADWKLVGYGDGFWAFRHPKNPEYIFSESQGGNITRFNTKTEESKAIKVYEDEDKTKLRFNWNTPIHISRRKPERMYMASQFLYASDDMGDTWAKISPDLTTNDINKQRGAKSGGLTLDNSSAENHCTIFTITESPLDENMLWVGTDDGNLQSSNNRGKTWKNLSDNIEGLPKGTWVSSIELSNYDKDKIYVSFDGHSYGDMTPYIFRSTDGGKSWQNIATSDIEGYVHVIREDTKNPNLLFAGSELGLYISLDGGSSWIPFTNNVPKVAVRDIAIHPTTNDLVLATHGRGIIILDDITPIRELNEEVLEKPFHLFSPSTTNIYPIAGQFILSGEGEFLGENPSSKAKIIYYQKKRHTFGDMFIEVLDASDKVIQKLAAGKSAGINVIEIETRLNTPKTATGATITYGTLTGPSLAEGIYKVRITKGKEIFDTQFSLQALPSSPHSAADRKVQNEISMKLYGMSEKLAYIATQVQDMKKQAEVIIKNNESLKESLQTFVGELETFNKTLVVTTGDMYTETAEDELREKIGNLYGDVVRFSGKPTNSQIEGAKRLEKELEEAFQKFQAILKQQLPTINEKLQANQLGSITVKNEEEFKNSKE